MADVFISYKREERARCVAIHDALVELKLSVWFDAHIEPGASFRKTTENEAKAAKAILVLWSRLACDSEWIQDEAELGRRGGKLVPAKLEPCDLPLGLGAVQAAELFDVTGFRFSDGWRQIVRRIGKLVDRPGLDDFVQCEWMADARLWRAWIANYPEDPLAKRAGEKLGLLSPGNDAAAKLAASAPPSPPSWLRRPHRRRHLLRERRRPLNRSQSGWRMSLKRKEISWKRQILSRKISARIVAIKLAKID